MAQRLARRLCNRCKEAYKPTPAELEEAGIDPEVEVEELFKPVGCAHCGKTGYRGRLGLFEVMTMSEEIERLTIEQRSSEDIRRVALEQGMVPLLEDGLDKALRGVTSLEEVYRVVA